MNQVLHWKDWSFFCIADRQLMAHVKEVNWNDESMSALLMLFAETIHFDVKIIKKHVNEGADAKASPIDLHGFSAPGFVFRNG